MQLIKYSPSIDLDALLARPVSSLTAIEKPVLQILNDVKRNGDAALVKYAAKFDKVKLNSLQVTPAEVKEAVAQVDAPLKKAIKVAYSNIARFHKAQKLNEDRIETTAGVVCWRQSRAIQSVGLYIPGGSAPLFSTVLMLGIPAQIAGCKNVVLCTPPDKQGRINPAILFAAQLCGITRIYKTGGAQAIGAMAFGTATVPRVDKIFGPGNQYVTAAKQLVQNMGVAIDMPAGPSEVMVVGDDSCVPAFVAADLLSQAEHGPDSQVVFVALNDKLVAKVKAEVELQLALLPRRDVAAQALAQSKIIVVKNEAQAVEIVNRYAPEHLILAVKKQKYFTDNVYNAGSVFIGNYTPESAGDYASGTNHTLPTNGYARVYAGVSLDAFVKKITYQQISAAGLKNLGPVIETMAAAEQLQAHKNAVSIRLQKIKR
jgi:histidinol dehydrogenase